MNVVLERCATNTSSPQPGFRMRPVRSLKEVGGSPGTELKIYQDSDRRELNKNGAWSLNLRDICNLDRNIIRTGGKVVGVGRDNVPRIP